MPIPTTSTPMNKTPAANAASIIQESLLIGTDLRVSAAMARWSAIIPNVALAKDGLQASKGNSASSV